PSKIPLVQKQIWELIEEANLQADLQYLLNKGDGHVHEWEDALTTDGTPVSLAQMQGRDVAHLVQELDGYLCELAGAQIRDGLHVLGQAPRGEQQSGLLQAMTRIADDNVPGMRQALALAFHLDLATMTKNPGSRLETAPETLAKLADRPLATN